MKSWRCDMDLDTILNASGQELTNLVAEQVMGWTNKEMDNGFGYPAPFWVNENNEKQVPSNFWHPSSNIKDVWDVVNKFEDCLKLESWDGFICEICNPKCVRVHAKTAPEAICRAALLSVRRQMKHDSIGSVRNENKIIQ